MTPDQLLDTIRKIKELTTNPYGVNLLLAKPERRTTDENTVAVQQFLDVNFRQNLGRLLVRKSISA
jgi:hypothetical protein